jgi:hypothetical protein
MKRSGNISSFKIRPSPSNLLLVSPIQLNVETHNSQIAARLNNPHSLEYNKVKRSRHPKGVTRETQTHLQVVVNFGLELFVFQSCLYVREDTRRLTYLWKKIDLKDAHEF